MGGDARAADVVYVFIRAMPQAARESGWPITSGIISAISAEMVSRTSRKCG
jgi:hypothetical protein